MFAFAFAITHCEWSIRDELYFQILMNVQLVRQTNVIKTLSVQICLVHILANVWLVTQALAIGVKVMWFLWSGKIKILPRVLQDYFSFSEI